VAQKLLNYLSENKVKILNSKFHGSDLVVEISVNASPGAKKEKIKLTSEGELKVYLAVRPVEGKANAALIERLAKLWKVPKSNVFLIGGTKSKSKKFKVRIEIGQTKDFDYYKSNWDLLFKEGT